MSLNEAGISSLDLEPTPTGNTPENTPGNVLVNLSEYTWADGTTAALGDVALRYVEGEQDAASSDAKTVDGFVVEEEEQDTGNENGPIIGESLETADWKDRYFWKIDKNDWLREHQNRFDDSLQKQTISSSSRQNIHEANTGDALTQQLIQAMSSFEPAGFSEVNWTKDSHGNRPYPEIFTTGGYGER